MSRCKASEIQRNEAYAYGRRYKVQGVWPKFITVGEQIAPLQGPYTLYLEPFFYLDGRFQTASEGLRTHLQPWSSSLSAFPVSRWNGAQ